jgi:hypothetical protein
MVPTRAILFRRCYAFLNPADTPKAEAKTNRAPHPAKPA